ncbi:MAG: hypothetical protein CTY29_02660 [Methylobacter sp.]|nr:MAG: hypothetical protein CTY29_02660 [Methylobacter sp.]
MAYTLSKNASMILFSAISWQVFASGSYDFGGSNQQYERLNQIYDLGKSALNRKIICSSCPLHQEEFEAENAASLVTQLSQTSDTVPNLSEDERQAVIYYLVNRYHLSE